MELSNGSADLVLAMLVFLGFGLAGILTYFVNRRRAARRGRPESPSLESIAAFGPYFRAALEPRKSDRLAARLAKILGVDAVAIADLHSVVGHHGVLPGRLERVGSVVARQLQLGRDHTHHHRKGGQEFKLCNDPNCPQTSYTAVLIRIEGRTVGLVCAMSAELTTSQSRALGQMVRLLEAQLGLEELKEARARLEDAEVDSLRAQISPHFIYNALNVIAAFIVTDSVRARQLVIEFANFTRYSFRKAGRFTSLAEELRAIESYVALQQARYGSRLRVSLQISPESLVAKIPYLSLQPLVENAIRHGVEAAEGKGHIQIKAYEEGALTVVTIEDDGAGMDPDRLRAALAGSLPGHHVGLSNVDTRMRRAFGEDFHLIIDTAPGEGTLVTLRIPKLGRDLQDY